MKGRLFIVVAGLLLAASCGGGKKEQAARIAELQDSLGQIIAQKDSDLNAMISTMNDILAGFEEINQAEGRITRDASNVERNRKGEIQENMNFIRNTLATNRERIAELEARLQQSGAQGAKLSATIESLNQQLDAKEVEIAELEEDLRKKNIVIEEQSSDIASLKGDVSALETANQQKSETVAVQDKELHTAWYVFGTKKELKEQQILDDGEVLRTGNHNQGYFTEVDTRELYEIKLYSKGAKLLTSHPSDSYTLSKDSNKQYVLHITNQDKFWSVSKYLVIQVK